MPEALPAGWALAAALNQWLLACAVLFAAGSALFSMWVPMPPAVAARAAVVGRAAALVAVAAFVLAIGLIGAEVFDDALGIFTPRAWTFGARTTLSTSAVFGVAGMALLLFGSAARGRRQRLAALAGAALAVGSFLVTGHPAIAVPRWLTTPAYGAHLLGAAFWMGALAPLAHALRTLSSAEATRVVAAFSRRAVYAVGAIVASGIVLSAVHLGSFGALTESGYGRRLIVKLLLAAAVIALAAYNKSVLTPVLQRDPAAPRRLRLVIAAEMVVLIVIVGAAVALSLVPPPA